MKTEKSELLAYALMIIGVVLLILTFIMAYVTLVADQGILPTLNLSEALGEIVGPLASAIIRVLYLGIMGWVGSIATIRGIQLYRTAKYAPQPTTKPKPKSDQA